MAKTTIIGDVHSPIIKGNQNWMLNEVHTAWLIFILNKFGLKAQRVYPMRPMFVDDVVVVWDGDRIDG